MYNPNSEPVTRKVTTKPKLTLRQKEERLKRVIKAAELEPYKNNRQWAIKHAKLRTMRNELFKIQSILRKYQK